MSDEKPQHIAGREWFKSSYSAGNGGDCVEVAVVPGTVHVRDSKDQAGPVLSVADAEWAAFTRFAANL
ncbi:DUF397 domain-containing protein [Streptomyces albus]|uniref:DUF397 domain-containing protein n=1 Tax=Streptomyces albus TaxID=1888 RepID=UPI00068DD0CC|nr:DUF397 domain-containing protein [Streptomyces albus]